MPTIAGWPELPQRLREDLVDQMKERAISLTDLNLLRLWIESSPIVLTESGIRISALSNFAAEALIQPRFFFQAKR